MENLKVKVTTEQESKEVQALFFELGYKFSMVDFCKYYNSVQVFDDGSGSLFEDHDTCSHKEITIQQLRDMVVLKRNDVNDANFCYGDYKVLKLQTMDYKIWDINSKYWVDHVGSQTDLRRGLIPIDKKMTETEYLMQGKNGENLMESVGQLKDNVNQPNHYTSGGIECLDAMQAMLSRDEFIGFLRGNVTKYLWRYQRKNGKEDIAKALWYLNKLHDMY